MLESSLSAPGIESGPPALLSEHVSERLSLQPTKLARQTICERCSPEINAKSTTFRLSARSFKSKMDSVELGIKFIIRYVKMKQTVVVWLCGEKDSDDWVLKLMA